MSSSGVNTAFVLQLMNAIGDGINGVSSGDKHPKRIPWAKGSYHSEFFTNARRQLRSMRFVHPETRKPLKTDIPCLKNLIDTLQGFKLLWGKLQSLGFESFGTRNINQDSLENLFGQVKAHDFRSNKPTCYQFETIFKSLLITSLTSKRSPGFNCEEDSGEFILSQCNSLLSGTRYLPIEVDGDELVLEDEKNDMNEGDELREIPDKSHLYSHSGDLIKPLQSRLPSIKSCSGCVGAFQKTSPKRQGIVFRDVHLQAKRLLGQIFTSDISHTQLGRKSEGILQKMVDFDFFTCSDHKKDVFEKFKALGVRISAQEFLTYINKVLTGRIVPKNLNRLCSPLQVAYQCYLKTIRKDKRPSAITKPKKIKISAPKISIKLHARKVRSKVTMKDLQVQDSN